MYSVLQRQQKVFQLFKLEVNLFLKKKRKKDLLKAGNYQLFNSLEIPAFLKNKKQVNPNGSYSFALGNVSSFLISHRRTLLHT